MVELPATYKILIIEDDYVSVMALQRSLRKLKIQNEVQVCHNAIDALRYLAEETKGDLPIAPHIVTLDLNMPRMSGLEFLERIRSDPFLTELRVFICTGADIPAEVLAADSPHVAGHLIKDKPLASMEAALQKLTALRAAALPPMSPGGCNRKKGRAVSSAP